MTEELKVIISAEISKLKEGVKEAQAKIDELASSDSKLSKFSEGFSKVGDAAKNGLKVAAGAVAGLATAFLALGPATEEYRTAMAKLDTAFQTAGSNANTAKDVYNDLYRVLGDTDVAVEAANHLAKLTTNEQDLAEWTNICQGVYATFGDSLPIEGLTEAANETAKTGELTGSLADALNWAGVSEDEFAAKLEACNTEAEREALIRETLSGLYSDAAAGYEENAAAILAQNEAQAKMNEAMAKLGEVAQPIMTMLTELGAEILADLTPYIQDFAEKYLPTIKEALSGVGEKIGEVISWIADHWELVTTIGGIILGVAAAISTVSTVLGIVNGVLAITSAVSLPIIGIIAAVVAGIAALIAIGVLLYKNWDEILAKAKEIWGKITEGISKAVEAVGEFFTNMKENIKEKCEEIKENVSNKFQEVKENMSNRIEEAKENTKEKFNQIKETMGTVMEAAKNTVKEKLNNIKQAYQDNGGGIKGIAAAAMEGVKGYFSSGLTFIDNLTGGKLGNIANVIKNKMNEAKSNVSNVLNNIKNTFSNIWDNVKNKVTGVIDKIKSALNFEFKLPKIKLPRFSISPAGWKLGDLLDGVIPKLSISWYAKGGVFDSPALFPFGNGQIGGLGENGAEAIVPLEKNTKWLEKIAEKLAEKSGNTPVVLQVDGKTFAQTSINSINQLTRQTGKLALNLT